MYKIRNTETGQFSSGGAYPHWTRKGRVWNELHHVRSHLGNNAPGTWRQSNSIYSDPSIVEIVQFDLREVKIMSIKEVL